MTDPNTPKSFTEMDPELLASFAGIAPPPRKRPTPEAATELKMVEETSGVLWSVRTGGEVFLVVRHDRRYEIHSVSDGGVEYLGQAATHEQALGLIQTEINEK